MKFIIVKIGKGIKKGISFFLIGFIRLYQIFLSPLIGKNCRFTPTCSAYGIEAISKHGPIKGVILTIWRILRCNPWGGSGLDLVPDKFTLKRKK